MVSEAVSEKKIIAITSDLHVDDQFQKGIMAIARELGDRKQIKGIARIIEERKQNGAESDAGSLGMLLDVPALQYVRLYVAGDATPFTPIGEWKEDPGYEAKKRVRKLKAAEGLLPEEVERLAREAQEKAWDTHRKEMIEYGLRSHQMSTELVRCIERLVLDAHVIQRIQKIKGNSTPIISRDQRKALFLSGRGNEPTIEDMLRTSSAIDIYEEMTAERYGSVLLVTIPYDERPELQERYLRFIKELPIEAGITDVFVIYHENRFPELVGMKGKPVITKCFLDQAIDVVRFNYPRAVIYEVVGHNHSIPWDEFRIRTEENTFLVPVGVDCKGHNGLFASTLLVDPKGTVQRIDYRV